MLRKQVMEQMINDAVLSETADDWNLRISDDFVRQYIQSIPYFQSNGRFNVQAYNTAVRNQGMTQRGFEEGIREDLVKQQLRNGIAGSAIATDYELNESIRLRDQERETTYMLVSGEKLAGDYQPSDEELKAYYDSRLQDHMVPERVKVEYILLSPETVGAGLEVTDENSVPTTISTRMNSRRRKSARCGIFLFRSMKMPMPKPLMLQRPRSRTLPSAWKMARVLLHWLGNFPMIQAQKSRAVTWAGSVPVSWQRLLKMRLTSWRKTR